MASGAGTVEVSMRKAQADLTIRVTGMRQMKIRNRIAAQIFRFGAWVAGTHLEIELIGKRNDA